jgi:hypothetical protein
MYSYTAFELNFLSVLPLPELLPGSEAEPDVMIRIGAVDAPAGLEGPIECYRADAHEIVLTWGTVGALMVRDGKELIIDPVPGIDEASLRVMILGSGLAMLLYQRGLTVLHASAVAVAGRVVAFLADRGWGKSSTAAALCKRGHLLVTDDILALDCPPEGHPLARFAYPQLKLWPETLEALGSRPEDLLPIRPDVDKRAYPLNATPDGSLPLERIYLLGNGSTLEMTSIPAQAVFLEIMRNLYVPDFGSTIFKILNQAAIFGQCARLTQNVTTRLIRRQNDLAGLPDIARLIECDLEHDRPGDLAEPLTLAACL